jgi:hypothetical protein
VLVLVPVALDGVFRGKEVPLRRRAGLLVGGAATLVFAGSLIAVALRPNSWFENLWPQRAARAVALAADDATGRTAVYPSDKHADWLLWKEDSLRGRVAYDVRFELLTAEELRSIVRFKSLEEGWERALDGYEVFVLDPEDLPRHRRRLVRMGWRVLFSDDSIVILRRTT